MKKAVTLIDALQDRRLLGGLPAFRNLSTWSRWLVFAKAMYGLAMSQEEERIFCHHTARSAYLARDGGFSRVVFIGGRQCGKDRFADSAITPFEAMRAKPEEDGTDLYALNVAQDARSSLRTQRMYSAAPFERIPALKAMVTSKTADTLSLSNGVRVACYPCRPEAVRGVRAKVVCLQEFAFFRNSENRDVSQEMLRAITPTLATTNGRLVIMSSPYAASGALYELHRMFFGRDDADTLVWVATAPEMNPTLRPDYLKQMLESDPDGYRSEVLGEFRDGVGLLLDAAIVDASTDVGTVVRPPEHGAAYVAAYDASGGKVDGAALGIARKLPSHQTELAMLKVWAAPHNPLHVITEAASILKQYGISAVAADKYAAGFVTEAMRRENITHKPAEMDRSEIFLEFAGLLNSGQIRLLESPQLRRELCALERRRGPSRDRVDHPRGAHDDAAVAAALACVKAAKDPASHAGFARVEWLL